MTTNNIEGAYSPSPIELSAEIARPKDRLIETFKQSFLALAFDLGGLLAGSILVVFSDILSLVPWVLIIYPSIISMRGVIGGFFSGRLSTALHLGTVRPGFLNNTRSFRVLVYSTVILTLQSSLMIGGLAYFINVSFWGAEAIESLRIFSSRHNRLSNYVDAWGYPSYPLLRSIPEASILRFSRLIINLAL